MLFFLLSPHSLRPRPLFKNNFYVQNEVKVMTEAKDMKLDELKKMVADAFEAATDKTTIEKAAVINQKIDEVQAEQDELVEKNAELLKSYKDVVLHTNIKPTSEDIVKNTTAQPQTMEEFTESWLETHNEDGSVKK